MGTENDSSKFPAWILGFRHSYSFWSKLDWQLKSTPCPEKKRPHWTQLPIPRDGVFREQVSFQVSTESGNRLRRPNDERQTVSDASSSCKLMSDRLAGEHCFLLAGTVVDGLMVDGGGVTVYRQWTALVGVLADRWPAICSLELLLSQRQSMQRGRFACGRFKLLSVVFVCLL